MKKTITSIIIGVVCATSSAISYAENLLSVYEQAKKNDPVVLKAQAQFLASQEDITQARSVLLPSISASASLGKGESESISNGIYAPLGSIVTTESESSTYGANLSMQLYHHDSWLRLDNAKKVAHTYDIGYQVAKQDLIIRVTQAYFDVLSAKDDLEFAKAEKAAIERQLEQTKQRYSVGLIAVTDVHEAQAQYDNAETEYQRALRLAQKDAMLRSVVETRKTNRDIAKAVLDTASKTKGDTVLYAPFWPNGNNRVKFGQEGETDLLDM